MFFIYIYVRLYYRSYHKQRAKTEKTKNNIDFGYSGSVETRPIVMEKRSFMNFHPIYNPLYCES